MKGISFGQYYPGDSLLHRLDPRIKIVLTILYIVCTFLCKSAVSFALLLLSVFVLILVSRIPVKIVLRSVRPLLIIIAFTFVINIFWTQGDTPPLLEIGFVRIYAEGIWNAVFMFFRIFSLVTGTGIFLTYTTTPMDLTDGLESLLSPLKKLHVPVHVFAMMMSITLRFIPTLSEETEKIMNAQRARGADFTSGSLIRRAKALIPILIPLFVSAINRALELANAMECRCYHGGEGRTRLKVLKCHARDLVVSLAVIAFGVGLVLLNAVKFGYVMK
ncbi:MAG: energy-coupling factor transporter transmembrane protein EcfT [Ruminococcaceae bacterium]|nr:energy-coupling factor transporter transmembrane protein EcfT [Oscillospiraceae bacterium]